MRARNGELIGSLCQRRMSQSTSAENPWHCWSDLRWSDLIVVIYTGSKIYITV